MKIELTKKQYKELLVLVSLGSYIRGAYADKHDEKYDDSEMSAYLLKYAKDFNLEKLAENFQGTLIETDEFGDEIDKIMEEYDEDEFWHRLITLLGQRDFYIEADKKELAEIKKDKFGWLPKRIQDYYAKYEKEFEKHGVERLEIKE
ncbi:MAG: hypothetical protein A3J83_04160 [Elusimicrobia bacterium RIFOXYA2_FULL_40_6]|nr:MAG: hypothetical protein A3J83_04160 [Elusimicrobia bacterium RIFOXYA2_FULL_40_6]